jgi:hypothetical protein
MCPLRLTVADSRAPRQAHAPRLAGDAERAIMRRKDAAELNGDVFLQQRDEAAAVGRSALSDIVGARPSATQEHCSGQTFRMMQVSLTRTTTTTALPQPLCSFTRQRWFRLQSCRCRCRSCWSITVSVAVDRICSTVIVYSCEVDVDAFDDKNNDNAEI